MLRVKAAGPSRSRCRQDAVASPRQRRPPSRWRQRPTASALTSWGGGRRLGAGGARRRRAHERCLPGPSMPGPGPGSPKPSWSRQSRPRGLWLPAAGGDGPRACRCQRDGNGALRPKCLWCGPPNRERPCGDGRTRRWYGRVAGPAAAGRPSEHAPRPGPQGSSVRPRTA